MLFSWTGLCLNPQPRHLAGKTRCLAPIILIPYSGSFMSFWRASRNPLLAVLEVLYTLDFHPYFVEDDLHVLELHVEG